jgi:hypothetical protein
MMNVQLGEPMILQPLAVMSIVGVQVSFNYLSTARWRRSWFSLAKLAIVAISKSPVTPA